MGFRGIYSAILVTGLAQMTPATAQSQAAQHEGESMPAPAPAVPSASAAAAPAMKATEPTAEIKATDVDPADRDLAAAPPEELRPAMIDPNAARRARAEASRGAPKPEPFSAPQPMMAAAAPTPQPIREQEGQPEPAVAANDRAAEPEPGGDALLARSQRLASSQWRPAAAPQAIPSDQDQGDARPAYDDRYRNAPAAYAADHRENPHGYGVRDPGDGALHAVQDRFGLAGPLRSASQDWQWGNRQGPPIAYQDNIDTCDGARTDRLQQRIRREADSGQIDPRTAQDLDDETIHAEDLRRSYCASGMNDWRAERLDRQYAQIEDRIRYEEGHSNER